MEVFCSHLKTPLDGSADEGATLREEVDADQLVVEQEGVLQRIGESVTDFTHVYFQKKKSFLLYLLPFF